MEPQSTTIWTVVDLWSIWRVEMHQQERQLRWGAPISTSKAYFREVITKFTTQKTRVSAVYLIPQTILDLLPQGPKIRLMDHWVQKDRLIRAVFTTLGCQQELVWNRNFLSSNFQGSQIRVHLPNRPLPTPYSTHPRFRVFHCTLIQSIWRTRAFPQPKTLKFWEVSTRIAQVTAAQQQHSLQWWQTHLPPNSTL